MGDLCAAKKLTCSRSTKERIRGIKLSRWELPISSSKSYWDGVCAEIEKKYKRVRDPYPALYPLFRPLPPTTTTATATLRHYDDIKFKISPPTPLRKVQKSQTVSLDDDNNLRSKKTDVRQKSLDDDDNRLKLPPTTSQRVKPRLIDLKNQSSRDHRVYSKNSCPQHKSAPNVSIFDDKISKFLKPSDKAAIKLPSIAKKKSVRYEQHPSNRSRSTSASSLRSREDVKPEKRAKKPPKLGAASLLPSFAKAISIDSSTGTRESIDSEDEATRGQIDADSSGGSSSSEKIQQSSRRRRDFLRVPNLSFVSSHPSFRKLSLVDSCEDDEAEDIDSHEISLLSQEEFMLAERNLRATERKIEETTTTTAAVRAQEEDVKVKVPKVDLHRREMKTIEDYDREYIVKALAAVTKGKNILIDVEQSCAKSASSSSEKSDEPVPRISKSKSREEPPVDYKDIHKKLKNSLLSDAGLNKKLRLSFATLQSAESYTIRSASRSTSGPSPDFDNNAIVIPPTGFLETIPSTKIFNRAKIDKCHACLHKPFKPDVKVKRELPLTTLTSVVREEPPCVAFSGSSSSASSEELPPLVIDDVEEERDFRNFLEQISERSKRSVSSDDEGSKDQVRVSFEATTPSPKSTSEPAFATDKRLIRLQSDHAKSLSVQTSDRSKTSTPSNLSSDSDEAALQDADKMPPSKFMAPCHAPINWRPSLEPLRALKLKKYMSIKARDAAITAKSEEGTESDSEEEMSPADKLLAAKKLQEEEDEKKAKKKKRRKKKKKKKPLVRIKSVVEKMTEFSSPIDVSEIKDKRMLKRAKTTYDFMQTASDESESEESEEGVTAEETKEDIPYSEAILKYRAGSPPPPVMSTEDIVDIVRSCLGDDDEEFKAPVLLSKLSKEFTRRIEEKCKLLGDTDDAESLKLGLKLFQSLIDSRRYLKATTYDPNLKFSHKQPPAINSRQLPRILPTKSYELVAPILGLPKHAKSSAKRGARIRQQSSLSTGSSKSDLTFDMIVHPPSERESTGDKSYYDDNTVNPYALFLKKSRRKAVVWRPLQPEDLKGYDPEATLEMRAARLMDRICKDFCEWLNQLGGKEQVIDEDTLKDMFEINFTAEACKSMQVVVKEMPTVPIAVAKARKCLSASELEATRKEIKRDMKVEKQKKRIHAFGRALPSHLRLVPPQGSVEEKWLNCKHIPKDLENMDVVWNGIMHLDSVHAFVGYLKDNPRVAPPKLLKNLMRREVKPVAVNKLNNEVEDDLLQDDFEPGIDNEGEDSEDELEV